jgi:hypothetical protein
MACGPKCIVALVAPPWKVNVIFEYVTSVPPVMSMTKVDAASGAGPPFSVMATGPVTSIPPPARVV